MDSFPLGDSPGTDSGNESQKMSLSASCIRVDSLESKSLLTGQSDSVKDITSAVENFIPAAEQSNKATIHLEGKLGVQVQVHLCACTFECVYMSRNTDSMMS